MLLPLAALCFVVAVKIAFATERSFNARMAGCLLFSCLGWTLLALWMKPENTFIRSVHRHIPTVYAEKMANPWRRGTADVWYSGANRDMWVEYKWISSVPARADVLPGLSAQQARWLNHREAEGREVAVIVGCPAGGVVFQWGSWNAPMSAAAFRAALVDRGAIANWIKEKVGESPCLSQQASPTQQKSSRRRTGSSSRRC